VRPSGPIAIIGARLIDGTGGAPLDDSVVIVEGDRIRRVGPRARVAVPNGVERVDARGKALLPGLVDVHCHINQPPEDMKR
jgi:imidazolonepropionase-like amidohydrolase